MIISKKATGLASLDPNNQVIDKHLISGTPPLQAEQMTFAPATNLQGVKAAPTDEKSLLQPKEKEGSQPQHPPISIPIHDLNQLRQIKKSIQKSAVAYGLIPSDQIKSVTEIKPTGQSNQVDELEKVKKQLQNMRPSSSSNKNNNGVNGVLELPSLQIPSNGGKRNQQLLMVQVRQKFMNLLGKLIDLQTREISNGQLKDMIMNSFSPEYLRIWISALSEYHSRPSNFSSSETEILLIGHIASVYREKLLDPVDKPPSVVKTSYKLCEMIQKYFYAKQINESIHRACASSWCAIYTNCLQNEPLSSKEMVLYTTLKNIINGGGDRIAQLTALYVLDAFLAQLVEVDDEDLISAIARSYFHTIFTRTGIESPSIVRCARHIVSALHVKNLMLYISLIIEKSISLLSEKQTTYKVKIAVCELLEVIAQQLNEQTDNIVGSYHETVIPVLQNSTRDRIMHVQNSAKQALSAWNVFKNSIEGLEQYKLHKTQQVLPSNIDVDQLIEQRTSGNKFFQKEQKSQRQSSVPQRNEGQSYSQSNMWMQNEQVRGQKEFIKKKSGTGGGFPISVPEQSKRPASSTYLSENNRLKEFIFNSRAIQENFEQSKGFTAHKLDNSGVQDTIAGSPREDDFNGSSTTPEVSPSRPQPKTLSQKQFPQKIKFRIEPDTDSVRNPNVIPPTSLKKQYDLSSGEEDELAETVDLNKVSLKETKNPTGILRPPSIGKSKAIIDQPEEIDEGSKVIGGSNNSNVALTSIWNDVLELADAGQFEKAFQRVIDTGDDIYLIRLMLRNRNGFKHLQRPTQLKILKKIITFMQNADQTSILEILHDMSELKSDIAPQACDLFAFFQPNKQK